MDRLTADSIAAAKAGMTYGKWKALHPKTEVNDIPQKDVKLCVICGCVIGKRSSTSGQQRRRYCSAKCADEAVNIRARERYHKREDNKNGKI